MALTRRYLIRLGLLLGLFIPAAFDHLPAAQQSSDQPGTFRLVSLGPAEPFRYDLSRNTPRTVFPTVTTYSKPHPIPADGKLRFYRLGETNDPKQPPPRIPVAELTVPTDEKKSLIIILIPGGLPGRPVPTLADGRPAEFSTIILDDSPEVSPKDHLRIVNFSKRPAGVKLGDTTVQLASFESRLIPYPPGKRAPFKVATYAHGQWIPIVSNTQMLTPNTRLTLFLSDLPALPDQEESSELNLRKIVEVFSSPQSLASR